MDSFELNVSLPNDVRFADTARELVVYAARQAGHTEEEARAFGRDIEGLIRRHMNGPASPNPIPLVVRRANGPVEVIINGRAHSPHS
jgi:hypothetical protein